MKTLIINGSPKKNGDTVALLNEFVEHLVGEVKVFSCFDDIAPCNDCRYCWVKSGCAIDDQMQDVFAFLDECDNVVIASPIWFGSLSGPTLNIASRMQTLFAARAFRNEPKTEANKNGVIILLGGDPGSEVAAEQNAKTILRLMHVKFPLIVTVRSMNTDTTPACDDEIAKKQCKDVAKQLNEFYKLKVT